MRNLRLPASALLCSIYLYGLGAMGLFGPDETRYADIGRAMAQTGDWVMPRLFGVPWFEKPALLYWLVGLGNLAGLGPEWAPRLPIALLSIGFVLFFWWRVGLLWNNAVAGYSAIILATSAGWIAYSHSAVTDIPLSVFFGAAMLLGVEWLESGNRRLLPWITGCLGLAALAKGIVPLALFCPIVVFGWRRAADWFQPVPILVFAVVALPWYILCSLQSHGEFPRVFFLEHTFGRINSPALGHQQRWWYYLPVFVLFLSPWFPLLPLIRITSRKAGGVVAVVVFGIFLFSISLNKLPGYILPLLPAASILLGEAFDRAQRWRAPLTLAASLCGFVPLIGFVLPTALAHGMGSAGVWTGSVPYMAAVPVLFGIAAAVVCARFSRETGFSVVAALVGISLLGLEIAVFPSIDSAASARPLWLATHPSCVGKVNRSLAYGLQYYAGHALPGCDVVDQDVPRVVR